MTAYPFTGHYDILGEDYPLPFAPGSAPHRSRGSLYLGLVRGSAQSKLGSTKALIDALPPAVAPFFEQKFEPTGWYDVWPFFVGARTLAKLLGQDPQAYLEAASVRTARRDLNGGARLALKFVSSKTITVGVFTFNKMFWDFLQFRTKPLKGGVTIIASGCPIGLRRGILGLGASYASEILRLTGSNNVRWAPSDFECDALTAADSKGSGSFSITWD